MRNEQLFDIDNRWQNLRSENHAAKITASDLANLPIYARADGANRVLNSNLLNLTICDVIYITGYRNIQN